jgi:hypothetical protein
MGHSALKIWEKERQLAIIGETEWTKADSSYIIEL